MREMEIKDRTVNKYIAYMQSNVSYHKTKVATIKNGKGLRNVDADKPVGLAVCFGREIDVIVLRSRTQVVQSVSDRLIREVAYPKTVKRFISVEMRVQVSKDQLTFPSDIWSLSRYVRTCGRVL